MNQVESTLKIELVLDKNVYQITNSVTKYVQIYIAFVTSREQYFPLETINEMVAFISFYYVNEMSTSK